MKYNGTIGSTASIICPCSYPQGIGAADAPTSLQTKNALPQNSQFSFDICVQNYSFLSHSVCPCNLKFNLWNFSCNSPTWVCLQQLHCRPRRTKPLRLGKDLTMMCIQIMLPPFRKERMNYRVFSVLQRCWQFSGHLGQFWLTRKHTCLDSKRNNMKQ